MPFRHEPESRSRAVALVRAGARPRDAALEVGADASTVYTWLHAEAPELVRSPVVRCFRCKPETGVDGGAYAHLLGLYLGDGWLTAGRRGVWSLSIACCDDHPRLAVECAESMKVVLAASVCAVRRRGCHELKAYSMHWPCLFPQHRPGKKHDRPIVLEPWQRTLVTAHAGQFLRGLFHSDGWRGTNVAVRRRGEKVERRYYARYEFTNHSADIRLLCTQALDALGIAWRRNGPHRVSVNRREAVAALDEHVGPKS